MINTIPGTDYRIPSPWDLMQAGPGITSRDWLALTYGLAAVTAWTACGCPAWTEPEPVPTDRGIMREGWGWTRWAGRRRFR
jgi:hypothetical protein